MRAREVAAALYQQSPWAPLIFQKARVALAKKFGDRGDQLVHRVRDGRISEDELSRVLDATPIFLAWLHAFGTAAANKDPDALRDLAGVAVARAEGLERRIAADKFQAWRQWLGPATAKGTAAPISPGKGAFRFVKGLTGWTRSPLGPAHLNEELEDAQVSPVVDDAAPWCDHPLAEGQHTAQWVPAIVGRTDPVPLHDQADVDREATKWGKFWRDGAGLACPFNGDDHFPQLALLLVPALMLAALSFPPDTGLGSDNISPRALARPF